jgi:hypothetical protein
MDGKCGKSDKSKKYRKIPLTKGKKSAKLRKLSGEAAPRKEEKRVRKKSKKR